MQNSQRQKPMKGQLFIVNKPKKIGRKEASEAQVEIGTNGRVAKVNKHEKR